MNYTVEGCINKILEMNSKKNEKNKIERNNFMDGLNAKMNFLDERIEYLENGIEIALERNEQILDTVNDCVDRLDELDTISTTHSDLVLSLSNALLKLKNILETK